METQANSVQVVLEPGKVNAPKEESSDQKGKINKIIHVVNPVYLGGLRRSQINNRSNKNIKNIERTERAVIEGEKTFENSIMLEKWKRENGHLFKSNFGRRHRIERRSALNARRYKKETMRSKKTEIEKVTRVHGRTGGLHLTTGKHGTKLISKGGALNVFIRNDGEKEHGNGEVDENSKRRSYPENTKYHVISAKMDGLSLKRDINTKRSKKCLIPPCMS